MSRADNATAGALFTPAFESIVQELGPTAALVFGAVWRRCQLRDGVCNASLQTMATSVGLNRRTVQKHLKRLVSTAYLEDLTPRVRHVSHRYRVLAKVPFPTSDGGAVESPLGVAQNPLGAAENPLGAAQSALKILEAISKMVNCGSNPNGERADGPQG